MYFNNFLFIDFQEIIIILVVVVLLFGPNSLPEIARGLGTAVRKFKMAADEIKSEIMNPTNDTNSVFGKEKNQIKGNLTSLENDFKKEFKDITDSLNSLDKRVKRDDS